MISRECMEIDRAIDILKSSVDFPDAVIARIKAMHSSTIEFAAPALLSALLHRIVGRQTTKRQKHICLEIMDDCVATHCSYRFLSEHLQKINAVYLRISQEQVFHNTSRVLKRLFAERLFDVDAIVHMLFLTFATADELIPDQLDTIRHDFDILQKLGLGLRSVDTSTTNRWRSEILTGYSCVANLPSIQCIYIKRNQLLRVSPLLNDLSFCECHEDDFEMLDFLSLYSTSYDIHMFILRKMVPIIQVDRGFEQDNDCYDLSGTLSVSAGGLEDYTYLAETIVDTLYARGVLDPHDFVDLNVFTTNLIKDEEYSQLVINKLLYLAKFFKSIAYLEYLVDSFSKLLEPYLKDIAMLLDNLFLIDYPDRSRIIIKHLVQLYQETMPDRYKNCSQAVLNYIQRISPPEVHDADGQGAAKKDSAKEMGIAHLKRILNYVPLSADGPSISSK